jgi:hypothetical protein
MIRTEPFTSFAVYRWANAETTSDYPFLAVAEDRSAVLSLGNYGVCFDWGIPDEAAHYLAHDFQPTGESLTVDLGMVRYLLDSTFAGGTEFGLVTFDSQLGPSGLQLSLAAPTEGDEGPEYVMQGFGSYLRFYRDPEQTGPVALAERAMLDVCVSTFAELAVQCAAQLTAPPPPRYCATDSGPTNLQ